MIKDKIKLDCIVDIYGRKNLCSQKSIGKTVTIAEDGMPRVKFESISIRPNESLKQLS